MFCQLPDVLVEDIKPYLSFEDKIYCTKSIAYNFFHYVNLTITSHESLRELFHVETTDYDMEYITDVCDDFIEDLTDSYITFQRGYPLQELELDHYHFLSYETIRELRLLFYRTYFSVYIRLCLEYIEDHHVSCVYHDNTHLFEVTPHVDINVHNMVLFYYKMECKKGTISIFCERCGLFGHDKHMKTCLLK